MPVLDLLNHRRKETQWNINTSDDFCMRAFFPPTSKGSFRYEVKYHTVSNGSGSFSFLPLPHHEFFEGRVSLRAGSSSAGLVIAVNTLVPNEVSLADEIPPTDQTFVRLHPSMDPLVVDQPGARVEAAPALGALVGLLPSVGSLMDGEE